MCVTELKGPIQRAAPVNAPFIRVGGELLERVKGEEEGETKSS